MTTVGVLLAAGAGTRMGMAKGLMRGSDGVPWIVTALEALRAGGCAHSYVVVGAQAQPVQALVPAPARIVVAADWQEGMGASLRAGLRAVQSDCAGAGGPDLTAAIIMLVDTPGVTSDVVARLRALAAPDALARAGYHQVAGHPVLIGRHHWDGVIDTAKGDVGARAYLSGRDVTLIESADVGSGRDYDTPDDLTGR